MARITRKARERGNANHGWLQSFHTFSFADYFDERWMGFKTLRVLNEDFIAPGKGFDLHGHRDMEILTYVLQGSLRHVDTAGNNEVLRAGEVQRMTAGSGIQHMELNASQAETCHLYQIWILPDEPGLPPGYEQKPFRERLEREGSVLAASRDGRDGSLRLHQDAELWLRRVASGEQAEIAPPRGKAAWVQIVSGKLAVGGEVLEAGDAVALDEAAAFQAESEAELMIFFL